MSRVGVAAIAAVVGLAVGFGLGFWTGADQGREEPAPRMIRSHPTAAVDLVDHGRTADHSRGAGGSSAEEATDPARPRTSTGAPAPVAAPARVDLVAFSIFDSHGVAVGRTVGVGIGGPTTRVLLPASVLVGAQVGTVSHPDGTRGRLTRVASRLRSVGLIAVQTDTPTVSLAVVAVTPLAGTDVWLHEWDDKPRVRPTRIAAQRFSTELGVEVLDLETRSSAESGGVLVDAESRLVGIVPPAGAASRSPAFALAVDRAALELAESIDLELEDYTRLYFEGTAEAFLLEARRHLANSRFALAIFAFRNAVERDGALRDAVLEELLAAHRGHVEELRDPDAQVVALLDALRDFPRGVEFMLTLARGARARRDYPEALRWYDQAWAVSRAQVGDLGGIKAGLYAEWTARLIREGRLDDALGVLAEAVRAVPDSADLWASYGHQLLRLREYLAAAAALREAVALDGRLAADLGDLIARAERLAEGPGKVVIDYTPGSRSIIAQVTLNGRATGEFIVDTGATTTMIPEGLARQAGINTAGAPTVRLRTAGNERVVPYAPADSVAIGALTVSGISVVVGDLVGMGNRGLLGMDFLGRFGFENDSVNGRLVIYERR